MKVYISPSSQTENKYAYGTYTEAQICRQIGTELKGILDKVGVENKLADKSLDVNGRVKDSNNYKPDLHICIHTNAGGGDGTLVMCYKGYSNNAYVKAIYNEVASLSPGKDDGIKENNTLAEVVQTYAVTVYVECEFHDNTTLAKWIVEHTSDIANSIAKAICETAGISYNTIAPTGLYKVQIGAFAYKENADNLAKELENKGYDTYIVKN